MTEDNNISGNEYYNSLKDLPFTRMFDYRRHYRCLMCPSGEKCNFKVTCYYAHDNEKVLVPICREYYNLSKCTDKACKLRHTENIPFLPEYLIKKLDKILHEKNRSNSRSRSLSRSRRNRNKSRSRSRSLSRSRRNRNKSRSRSRSKEDSTKRSFDKSECSSLQRSRSRFLSNDDVSTNSNTNSNSNSEEITRIHNYYNNQIHYMRTQFMLELEQLKMLLNEKEKNCQILAKYVQDHILSDPRIKNHLNTILPFISGIQNIQQQPPQSK